MPGLVGYTCDRASKGHKPLAEMTKAMGGNFLVDRFYGRSLHIARLHLGIFNVEEQPVWNENRALGIMTYGKIYGYEREMEELEELGHKFTYANNDAEFILHSYEEFGNDTFSKLNGSYAFMIFNDAEADLVVASDRFGTRPIYYTLRDGKLIFASATRAILKYPYPKSLDEKTIVRFFRYGKLGILGDSTWFEGIQLMPAASFLKFHDGKIRIERYWDLNYLPEEGRGEESSVKELVKKFKKAVNIRVDDNIRSGLSLSGGLDSRSVCAALDSEKLSEIHAYTFGVENCNEFKIASLTTSRMGLKNHTLVKLDPNDLARYAENVVYLTDGLDTVGVSFLPYVGEKIREMGIEVSLQGFILDATLGGSFMTEKMFKARNIDDLLRALDDWYTLFSPSEMRALLGERLRHMIGDVHREFAKSVRSAKGGSFPDKADYFTLNTRVRRYTNLGSIITREFVEETLPTIDNEVIDVISKIPAEYRYGHHLYRKFLSALDQDLARIPYVKTMVRADAPDFFWKLGIFCLRVIRFTKRALWKFSRGKISLPNKHYYIDMAEVWRASPAWRKLLRETILNDHSTCYERDYLNKDFVEKVVEEHYGGIKNNSEKIAFLVTFELFLRIFFERKK